jgi:hypothetical protein
MRILKTKTEEVNGGWIAKIYDTGILVYTTEVFETEKQCREAALNKSLELQNQPNL